MMLFTTLTPEEGGLILTALNKFGSWMQEAPSTAEHLKVGQDAVALAKVLKKRWEDQATP